MKQNKFQTISNIKVDSSSNTSGQIILDPVSGDLTLSNTTLFTAGKSYSVSMSITDYQERYTEKKEVLAAIIRDGDEFGKEAVRDLVLTANKAVYQESKTVTGINLV